MNIYYYPGANIQMRAMTVIGIDALILLFEKDKTMATNYGSVADATTAAPQPAPQGGGTAPGIGGATGMQLGGMLQLGIAAFSAVSSNASYLRAELERKLVEIARNTNNKHPVAVSVRNSAQTGRQFIMVDFSGWVFAVALMDMAAIAPGELRGRLFNGGDVLVKGVFVDAQNIAREFADKQFGGLISAIPTAALPQREDTAAEMANTLVVKLQSFLLGVEAESYMMAGNSAKVIHLKENSGIVAQNDHAAVQFSQRFNGAWVPYHHPALSVITSVEPLKQQRTYTNPYEFDPSALEQKQAVGYSTAFLDLVLTKQTDPTGQLLRSVWAPNVVITSMGGIIDSLPMTLINLAASASYYTNPADPGYLKALIGMTDGNIGNLRMFGDDSTRSVGPMTPEDIQKMVTMFGGRAPTGTVDQNGNAQSSHLFMDMSNPANSGCAVSVLVDLSRGNVPMTLLRYFDIGNKGMLRENAVQMLRAAFQGIDITAANCSFDSVSLRVIGTKVGSGSSQTVQLVIPSVLNLMGDKCQLGALTPEQQSIMGGGMVDPYRMQCIAELAVGRQIDIHGLALELRCSRAMLDTCALIASNMNTRIATGNGAMSNYMNAAINYSQNAFISTHQPLVQPSVLGGGFSLSGITF